MKSKKLKQTKCLILVGAVIFLVSCVVTTIQSLDVKNTWMSLILIASIYIPFAAAGFIYTSIDYVKKKKSSLLIRCIVVFYGFVLIALIILKLFNKLNQ